MADTTVKFFDSNMTGAPTLTGTVGALLAILDACLINGFGLGTADSVIIASGVATVTRAAGHPFQVDAVAFLAGATTTGGSINGEQKVTSVTSTTYTFVTALANQTATGTITHKLAALGWTKTFTSTNLGSYKSSDVTSSGMTLRVDDTNAQFAKVVGYETMSDVNTGTGSFPTTGQNATGLWWDKSSTANATGNNWMIFGDGKLFYFARGYRSGNNADLLGYELSGFGDFVSTKSGDAYGCFINGESASQAAATIGSINNLWYGQQLAATGLYATRSYSGLGSSIPMGKAYPTINGITCPGASGTNNTTTLVFPNPTDGGMYVAPQYVFEAVAPALNVFRGTLPGFYCTPQGIPAGQFSARDIITGVTGLTGRNLRAITCTTNAPAGVAMFDITGPWR